jgi:hypothetical protein
MEAFGAKWEKIWQGTSYRDAYLYEGKEVELAGAAWWRIFNSATPSYPQKSDWSNTRNVVLHQYGHALIRHSSHDGDSIWVRAVA